MSLPTPLSASRLARTGPGRMEEQEVPRHVGRRGTLIHFMPSLDRKPQQNATRPEVDQVGDHQGEEHLVHHGRRACHTPPP